MDFRSKSVVIFIIVAYFTSNISGEDVCVKTGPCTCLFPNGTGIDLSPVDKTQVFSESNFHAEGTDRKQLTLTTYYYHPCYDVEVPGMMNKTNSNDTCDRPLALCRHVDTLSLLNTTTKGTYQIDTGLSSFLGSANDSTFSAQGNAIIYPTNKPSGTIVFLACAETDDQLHADDQTDPAKLVLTFYSRSACLKMLASDEGRSLGSTLLIIFFSLVIFYLVLGVCTKKFLMGATGVEVIPNLGFWTDLPNLVKDGWAFAINGFKLPARGPGPVTSPDPNSYDSI